jgi:hypothetical protein
MSSVAGDSLSPQQVGVHVNPDGSVTYDFLANLRLAFGRAFITYPGGSQWSNPIDVAHGLGAVPQIVVATMQLVPIASGGHSVEALAGNPNLTLRAHTIDGSTPAGGLDTYPVYWFALG